MRALFLLLLAFTSFNTYSQSQDSISININARIRSTLKNVPLQETIAIEIMTDSVEFTQVLPVGEEFEFGLPFQDEYTVKFSSPGFHPKVFYFNLITPADTELKKNGYALNLQISLEPTSAGADAELFKVPVAKAAWSAETKDVEFDKAYSEERVKLIEASRAPKN